MRTVTVEVPEVAGKRREVWMRCVQIPGDGSLQIRKDMKHRFITKK